MFMIDAKYPKTIRAYYVINNKISIINVELQILSKINNHALHCTHIDKRECNDFLLSEENRSNETLIIEPVLYQNIREILFTIIIELFTLYII